MAVIEVRNRYRAAHTAPESVEVLRSLGGEVQNFGIEGVVLHVLEETAVVLIGAALGDESDVGNLREFGAVVERGHLHFGNSFRRWIGIRQRAIGADIRG